MGYFAHNRGPRSWHIEGAGVQGYNVRYCGLITMGEAWHNNHHAFPASARLGLGPGEADPGWWVLRALMAEPTRVLTKEELLRDVWGFRSLGTTRTLDSHACRLRQKLSVHGDRFVINVWGVGYRLVDGPVLEEAAA